MQHQKKNTSENGKAVTRTTFELNGVTYAIGNLNHLVTFFEKISALSDVPPEEVTNMMRDIGDHVVDSMDKSEASKTIIQRNLQLVRELEFLFFEMVTVEC